MDLLKYLRKRIFLNTGIDVTYKILKSSRKIGEYFKSLTCSHHSSSAQGNLHQKRKK